MAKIFLLVIPLLSIFLLINCSNNKTDHGKIRAVEEGADTIGKYEEFKRINDNIVKAKENITLRGNKGAYNYLADFYWHKNNTCEIFKYSKLMADQYNSPHAHYEVFICLSGYSTRIRPNHIKEIKTKGKKKEDAIKYLRKADELGYEDATYVLKNLGLDNQGN